jgi:peroxiredoxin
MAYRIEGKLDNLTDQVIYVVFESEDRSLVDTVVCEKPGQFTLDQPQEGFNLATLFFENKSAWFTVYLEPNVQVKVSGDVRYPALLQAKGGKLNKELSAIRAKMASLLKEQADLFAGLNRDNGTGAMDRSDMSSKWTNVNHQLSELALTYIQEHPSEQASVILIHTFFVDPDDTRKLDELLIALDPALKDFYLVKELEQYSVKAKLTALGAEAPNFTVKNVYGESVALDSFANKYLILAFTAPWCDMCRTDDLYLDEIERLYSKDDLEQLLVSLDDDLEGVRQLLEKDSIPWNLVTDSARQATLLIDLYNVAALPRCFLIDKEGKIILKTESGLEIKQTLEQLIMNEDTNREEEDGV